MKRYLFRNLCFLSIFFISQTVLSQHIVGKGAHQLQKEEFGQLQGNYMKPTNNKSENILSLQKNQTNELRKKVFGFLPYWEQSSGAHNNIRYDLLTHIACFDFLVQLDASLATPPGWPWTTEINAAHAQGVKVIMTVVNFGGADGADAVAWEMMTNTSKQAILFNNIKTIIQTYNLDGVNIDFEGMISAHRGAELNTFMANLTTYIHAELPEKEVSFSGPAVNWGGWIIDELVDSVDYLIVMAYDYTSANSPNSGPVAPLTHHTSWKRFVQRTIETGTYAVPVAENPEKIILAVPYYGQHWKTATDVSESETTAHVSSTRYRDTAIEVDNFGGYEWNDDFQTSWYKWHDGINWNQVWADNELSISKKFDLAIDNNLGGVGMWALNYDGVRQELWDLISTKFSATASVSGNQIKENIKVYPNPTEGIIEISNLGDFEIGKIEVISVLGEKIMNVSPNSKLINMTHLSSGIYFLKIEDKQGRQGTFKILKSN